ncbi:MAG: nucleoside-triphosphatase [Candidatus Neomarinimicrobiota bacterium]|jgi:nucleoside-triphosphatase THEP1
MITLVSGDIDSGKTRYLKDLYKKDQKGDGIISIKYYEADRFIGYDLVHLTSGKQKAFIRLKTDLSDDWKEAYVLGRFSFSKQGLAFGQKILSEITSGPVYIDEIGPVELWYKKGFYEILEKLIKKDLELFLSLRPSLIDDIHDEFGLSGKTKIIKLK